MVVNKKGDLLKADDCTAIIHQVNCIGLMGGGIAKQIKEKWCDEVFYPYQKVCTQTKDKKELLGKIQVIKTNDSPIEYVINAFAQCSVGKYNAPFPNGRQTDYEALFQCFNKIKKWCKDKNITNIGMPKNIGCGLAGGNWDEVVYPMIKLIFWECEDIKLTIYDFYVPPFQKK